MNEVNGCIGQEHKNQPKDDDDDADDQNNSQDRRRSKLTENPVEKAYDNADDQK